MSKSLRFQRPHLSITELETRALPDFTILTGVNGSGKSHLLQAIENRSVGIDGLTNPRIVHFNAETFRLDNEPQFTAQQIEQERYTAWDQLNKLNNVNVRQNLINLRQQSKGALSKAEGIAQAKGIPIWNLKSTDFDDDAIYAKLREYKENVKNFFANQSNLKGNQIAQSVYIALKKLEKGLDEVGQEDFTRNYEPHNLKNDFLPIHLGKVFADYFSRYEANQYSNFRNKEYEESRYCLTEEEFIAKYGPKPWDVVNTILAKMRSVPYRVEFPEDLDRNSRYSLKLRHTEKPSVTPQFSELSSGERILMALVASVYKTSSDQSFPDVLLLDEIDASLHPSMMKNLLEIVDEVFLANNVMTIMVSHSPTTIALAPEEAIHVMNPSGSNRVEKRSRSDALRILTEGFATLDEGLKIFDLANQSDACVVTEGRNIGFVEAALKFAGISDVSVIKGAEDRTGKSQLKTLYDFFSAVDHSSKIIVLWDCDCSGLRQLESQNKTFPFVMEKFEHEFCEKGIENAFEEHLFEGFLKTTKKANGQVIQQFDESEKANFEKNIIERSNPADFSRFSSFTNFVREVVLQS